MTQKKRRKSSRAAILAIRMRRIGNGQRDSNADSPVFVFHRTKITKVSPQTMKQLAFEAEGYAFFAGEYISPDSLLRPRTRKRTKGKVNSKFQDRKHKQ